MTRIVPVALLAAGLIPAPLLAQDGVDAKCMEILKKTGALYKDAKAMHADLSIDGTLDIEGQPKREVKVRGEIDFKRPNFIAIRSSAPKDSNLGVEIVGDGKNMYILSRRLKQFTEKKAPDNLAEIGRIILPLGQQNTGMLFQNVLAEDPTDQLLEGVTEGKHAGMDKVGDKPAYHLTFKQPNLDWEIWVAAEGKPYILKANNLMELPNGKLSTVETYSNWKLDPSFDKDPFQFKAPEDAKKVDRLGRPSQDDDKDK